MGSYNDELSIVPFLTSHCLGALHFLGVLNFPRAFKGGEMGDNRLYFLEFHFNKSLFRLFTISKHDVCF